MDNPDEKNVVSVEEEAVDVDNTSVFNEDDDESEPDSMPNFSKVTPDKKAWPSFWWLLGVAAIVWIVFLSSHHRSVKEKVVPAANSARDADETLKSNMNALHQKEREVAHIEQRPSTESESIQTPVRQELSQQDLVLLEQAHEQALENEKMLQARFGAPSSFMSTGGVSTAIQNSSSDAVASGTKSGTTTAVLAGNNINSAFANQNTGVDTASAIMLTHPETTVAQGEFVQAVLETPINSDLPGMVRAVTSQPIYAYTGNRPMIPAGARLVGQYSSGVVQGQSRVMVVWNRVLLPDGTSAQLNSPGTDDQGISGQGADSINRHFWSQFGEATLLSILGAGASTVGVNSGDQYNSAAYYRTAMSQSFSDTASSVLEQNINTKPTLIIHQGAQINVFVARDVDFYSVLHASGN